MILRQPHAGFPFSLCELASQRSGPCLGPCRGAQPMLFIQKRKVSAEPSGDVGARRYQATRSVKQPFAKTLLSGRPDSARCQRVDLLQALKVRVAQQDRLNGVGDIGMAILARKLQALGVVRVNLQGHISRGRNRLHSLVVLKP